MRRRAFLCGLGGFPAVRAYAAVAQQRERTLRIGFLHPGSASVDLRMAAVRDGWGGSREQGPEPELVPYLGGGDVSRMPALAAELADLKPNVILAVSRPGVIAATATTSSIPIVALDLESDPVESGWVESLARPGRNVTGIFLDLPGLSAKCVELLREAIPNMRRVAVLWDRAMGEVPLESVRRGAATLGIELRLLGVGRASDLPSAFRTAADDRVDGILMVPSPLFGGQPRMLAELALVNKLPAITPFPDFAQHGGLLAYGPELQDLFQQAGMMARKVAEGAKPQDTPVQRPVRFRFVVNQGTAKRFGLDLPPSLLARADEVIE